MSVSTGPHVSLRDRRGLTLVEVLVSLGIVGLNVVGWMACLNVAIVLARRLVELSGDDGSTGALLCAIAAVVGRPTGVRAQCDSSRERHHSSGVTLVELLIAVAVGSVVVGLLIVWNIGSLRLVQAVGGRADAISTRTALETMLTTEVAAAGRSVGEGMCGLGVRDGGRQIVVRTGSGADMVTDLLFATVDTGGRPALFIRRIPHPRQPWIEDVTALHVVDMEYAGSERLAAVTLNVTHRAIREPFHVRVALPHHPCLEVLP